MCLGGRALLIQRPGAEQGAGDDGVVGQDACGPPERHVVAVGQRRPGHERRVAHCPSGQPPAILASGCGFRQAASSSVNAMGHLVAVTASGSDLFLVIRGPG